jgi:Tol biopolymer transport system component
MNAEHVRTQLDRILASAPFADAERARSFLRFVVERALEGRGGEIKESVIGVEALGRNTSFDPKSDPIVRVEAGRLRDRLSSYYEGEGEVDSVLISLPKGRYVPEFSERRLSAAPKRNAVLRLSILPPENASFESFAVSPDGRKLAFTVFLNGKLMVWVRALDSLEAKPLAGTEFASNPFWSPDSRSIGFFTPSKLKTVDVAGGPARDVADVVVGRGGAWSPEDVIVFCPRPIGILHQVAAAGGTPQPVTSLDVARAEAAHAFPQFLPGGRQFFYLAASSRPGESSIRVGSLDSTASKVLLNADTSAAYAPVLRGHPASLLFVHDGALMAQPFDTRRMELSGERTVVVPEVRYQRWHQASFSVSDNGVLLYHGGRAGNHQFGWFDRQGRLLAEVGPRNDYLSFRLSPDERHVVVNRLDDPDTVFPTIWVMDLLREGAVFRFTDIGLAKPEFTDAWSPDSREILFSRGDDRGMRLLRQALNGGTARTVIDTEGPKFPSDWSSDGQVIAYGSQWPDYRYMHIWIVALSASEHQHTARPFLQHSHGEFSAHFSPANEGEPPHWLAYMSNETGRYEVYVRDFPTGNYKWQISNQGGLHPQWRSDGRELFYVTLDGTLMAVAVTPGPTFEFGAPQRLFETGLLFLPQSKIWMDQYAVSRDGQRFLLNRRVAEANAGAITAVIPW